MTARPDMSAVADLLAERMPELARDLVGAEPSHRARQTWRFRSRGSLAVEVGGPKRGSWFDHEAGEGGDALALVAHLRREPMGAAYAWALGWLGLADGAEVRPTLRPPAASPEAPHEARHAAPSETRELARRVWCEAVAPAATLVERYLAARGLHLEPGAPLLFHPECPRGGERWPAMVALMTDPASGEACGVHRTFLARDGSGKAPGPMPPKMMAGSAGIIRLVADAEVTTGLGLAEGIETALSVMQGFGWRPVWAATSAGALARFPVLPGLEALTIFADADSAGAAAAKTCAARWVEAGLEARICAPPQGDFNDLTRGSAA